ncbi:Fe-S cluster assembly protein SufD [Bythopirellula polymerisocia]|uniref:FeS cluster assembly protein SufB n=1 Tax=Bythopirellula polymerisocia TaxID=2528003 RepID=A0A5C6C7F4_9BACT|nr:Fe-S cluster assembly protein SufD [Bythopirellula polymerisocia]TWU20062.1 FeS cluster assembly protein SufB [Bythopirellula polymerisocia]
MIATALSTTGFSQEVFDAFLAERDEPGWLTDRRVAAWSQFNKLGMPNNRDEEWMRTDIRLFHFDRFAPFAGIEAPSELPPALLATGVDLAGRSVSLDSRSLSNEISDECAKQGVLFGSLDSLVKEHGNLLRPYIERQLVDPNQDKFSALNAALWSGANLLFVPKGVKVARPFHSFTAMSAGGVDLGKTLVILEQGAEATLLTETASTDPEAGGMHCGSIELILEKEARLRYVNLQNWGSGVWHFAHQMGHVGANAGLQWTIGALGSRLAKVNQHVALTGPDAEAQVNGVMFTHGKQHLCYNTHQHHKAPFCRSDLLYKSALQDKSRTVWRGMIKVDEAAQRTDAYQRNDNLMLSTAARADSIPGLEIEADDVRCTHGSTSGRVDDHQLFYAMTRGYTRQEAVRMIVSGFFQQVFDRITIESVRDALGEAIGRRVRDIEE